MTFTESKGFATARQVTVDESKISRVDRSTVAEGDQTLAQHSGQRSASDLPSAQGGFKQVCKKSAFFLSHLLFWGVFFGHPSSSITSSSLLHCVSAVFFPVHQALGYIGGCGRVERPRVVGRETVKEDGGAVVKRCV